MRQVLYYWYIISLFSIRYYFNSKLRWITSTYHKGSCNTIRVKKYALLLNYLKASKYSVDRHFLSDVPLSEKYLHDKSVILIFGAKNGLFYYWWNNIFIVLIYYYFFA